MSQFQPPPFQPQESRTGTVPEIPAVQPPPPYYQYPPFYQQQALPPARSPRDKRRERKEITVAVSIILVIVAIFVAVGVYAGFNAGNSSSGTSNPTTQTFSGNGAEKTELFTVPNQWQLSWSCDPSSFSASAYNVIVSVYRSDGTLLDPIAVNTLCQAGNTEGTTQEYSGGAVYLSVNSEAAWTITVRG